MTISEVAQKMEIHLLNGVAWGVEVGGGMFKRM